MKKGTISERAGNSSDVGRRGLTKQDYDWVHSTSTAVTGSNTRHRVDSRWFGKTSNPLRPGGTLSAASWVGVVSERTPGGRRPPICRSHPRVALPVHELDSLSAPAPSCYGKSARVRRPLDSSVSQLLPVVDKATEPGERSCHETLTCITR